MMGLTSDIRDWARPLQKVGGGYAEPRTTLKRGSHPPSPRVSSPPPKRCIWFVGSIARLGLLMPSSFCPLQLTDPAVRSLKNRQIGPWAKL